MNRAEKIKALYEKKGKTLQLNFLGNWLWIDEGKKSWNVTIASGCTSHNPKLGPAYSADFRKEDGERAVLEGYLTGVWKSALSMWPVREEQKAKELFDWIAEGVDRAYNKFISK